MKVLLLTFILALAVSVNAFGPGDLAALESQATVDHAAAIQAAVEDSEFDIKNAIDLLTSPEMEVNQLADVKEIADIQSTEHALLEGEADIQNIPEPTMTVDSDEFNDVALLEADSEADSESDSEGELDADVDAWSSSEAQTETDADVEADVEADQEVEQEGEPSSAFQTADGEMHLTSSVVEDGAINGIPYNEPVFIESESETESEGESEADAEGESESEADAPVDVDRPYFPSEVVYDGASAAEQEDPYAGQFPSMVEKDDFTTTISTQTKMDRDNSLHSDNGLHVFVAPPERPLGFKSRHAMKTLLTMGKMHNEVVDKLGNIILKMKMRKHKCSLPKNAADNKYARDFKREVSRVSRQHAIGA